MTIAHMRRFRAAPLALRPEADDVVYAGAAASALRTDRKSVV